MNKFLITLIFFLTCPFCFAEIIKDDFAIETLQNTPAPYVHTKYNYENTDIVPIKLAICEKIKSEQDVYEGQEIKFQILKHVVYKNKIIARKGTIVTAKVKIIITSGMNGIPASIIFEDFQIPNIEYGQISDLYEVYGQDRSLLVFPLKWALTILPPTGSLTNFIKGGHAKLKPNKKITIFYNPKWI